ncbi:hypothetical protein B0H13DRAFT_568704 [Mycena leptocephala]|nr:hypothetical protein B0H13DRAFT_568704 [Mycena leptocephala]
MRDEFVRDFWREFGEEYEGDVLKLDWGSWVPQGLFTYEGRSRQWDIRGGIYARIRRRRGKGDVRVDRAPTEPSFEGGTAVTRAKGGPVTNVTVRRCLESLPTTFFPEIPVAAISAKPARIPPGGGCHHSHRSCSTLLKSETACRVQSSRPAPDVDVRGPGVMSISRNSQSSAQLGTQSASHRLAPPASPWMSVPRRAPPSVAKTKKKKKSKSSFCFAMTRPAAVYELCR